MESRGVAGRPKDPKGAQGGSPKEGPKEDPKRIPKGSQWGLGTPLTSSSLYQESDSAVSTNQYSLEPPFMMLMLLMVSQPLRITCGHGAVMGPLWGRYGAASAPSPPPHPQPHRQRKLMDLSTRWRSCGSQPLQEEAVDPKGSVGRRAGTPRSPQTT